MNNKSPRLGQIFFFKWTRKKVLLMEWLWLLVDLSEQNPYGHYHFLPLGIWLFSTLAACVLSDTIHLAFSLINLTTASSKITLFKNAALYSCLYYGLFVGCLITGFEWLFGFLIFLMTALFIVIVYPRILL
jgi:hypothetical protein